MKNICWLMLLTVLLIVMAGCAVEPISSRYEQARSELTLSQEMSLGKRAQDQVLQALGGIYPDRELGQYIDSLGQQLARYNHRSQLTYRFSIANDSSPDAYALPGGFIVITRGLLADLSSEVQLASVLAREIAHCSARHSVQVLRRSLRSTGRDLADILTLDHSGYAGRILQARVLTEEILDLGYSEGQRLEADNLSAEILTRAGYSAQNPPAADEERFIRETTNLTAGLEAYQLYDSAKMVEREGAYGPAIEIYHRAMQKAPDHGLLLTALGMAYLRNEDLVPARRYLLKAVRADSDYYRSHMGLGYVYLANEQADQAARHLQLSVDLLPTVEGVFLLAEVQLLQAHLVRARELYQDVIESDDNGRLKRAATERLKILDLQ